MIKVYTAETGFQTHWQPGSLSREWVDRYIDLAAKVASWSKDPSTKVGAVLIRDYDKSIASCGFNGFPRGDEDRPEDYLNRELKLMKVVHAETNVFNFCREDTRGFILFTYPFAPCPGCAGTIIGKHIKEVYYPPMDEAQALRWHDKMTVALSMFKNAGVKTFCVYPDKIVENVC